MASSLNYMIKAAIGGGPALVVQDKFDTESFIYTQVTLPNGVSTDIAVGAGAATEIQMICIAVDAYKDAADAFAVTMAVGDGGAAAFTLEGPMALIGAGAAALLGDTIDTLTFANDTGADRTVTILVARNA